MRRRATSTFITCSMFLASRWKVLGQVAGGGRKKKWNREVSPPVFVHPYAGFGELKTISGTERFIKNTLLVKKCRAMPGPLPAQTKASAHQTDLSTDRVDRLIVVSPRLGAAADPYFPNLDH